MRFSQTRICFRVTKKTKENLFEVLNDPDPTVGSAGATSESIFDDMGARRPRRTVGPTTRVNFMTNVKKRPYPRF